MHSKYKKSCFVSTIVEVVWVIKVTFPSKYINFRRLPSILKRSTFNNQKFIQLCGKGIHANKMPFYLWSRKLYNVYSCSVPNNLVTTFLEGIILILFLFRSNVFFAPNFNFEESFSFCSSLFSRFSVSSVNFFSQLFLFVKLPQQAKPGSWLYFCVVTTTTTRTRTLTQILQEGAVLGF